MCVCVSRTMCATVQVLICAMLIFLCVADVCGFQRVPCMAHSAWILSAQVPVSCVWFPLCFCVLVCLGSFIVSCVCVFCVFLCFPSVARPFSELRVTPVLTEGSGVADSKGSALSLSLGCANHWVLCRWQMCGCQAGRRDSGGGCAGEQTPRNEKMISRQQTGGEQSHLTSESVCGALPRAVSIIKRIQPLGCVSGSK